MIPYYARPIGTKNYASKVSPSAIGVSSPTRISTSPIPAKAWGAEHLSEPERMPKIISAGIDQFGGEHVTVVLPDLVRNGSVSEERIGTSVRRLMHEESLLSLFDSPFVDLDAAERIIGNGHFVQLGAEAQRRSCTLLTNDDTAPLRRARRGSKFDIEGFDKTYTEARNVTVVDTPEEADFALLEMGALPFPRLRRLREEEKARQAKTYAAVFPTYGGSTGAFLDVAFGLARPEGRLPSDLPRSMVVRRGAVRGCALAIPRTPSSGPETVRGAPGSLANPIADALGRGTPKLRTATILSFYFS
ncbi:hypothetical protein DL765_002678 [Monosporascus sp. GIB2]|nr:hypothetical protein DL765_002678 [Monosporascus sp. GIB2]